MANKIQLRRDTSVLWTTVNPILSSGEIGFETNTGKFKIGNGVDDWNTLSYFASGGGAVTIDGYDIENETSPNIYKRLKHTIDVVMGENNFEDNGYVHESSYVLNSTEIATYDYINDSINESTISGEFQINKTGISITRINLDDSENYGEIGNISISATEITSEQDIDDNGDVALTYFSQNNNRTKGTLSDGVNIIRSYELDHNGVRGHQDNSKNYELSADGLKFGTQTTPIVVNAPDESGTMATEEWVNTHVPPLEAGSVAPTDTAPVVDGIYRAKEAGDYDNLATGLVAKEGYVTWFKLETNVWTLYSEVEVTSSASFQKEIDDAIGTDDGTIFDYETGYTPDESFTSVAGWWFIQPQLLTTNISFLKTIDVISIAGSSQVFGVFEKVGDFDFKLIQTLTYNTSAGNNSINVLETVNMNNNYTVGVFVNATSGIYAKEGGLEPYRYCSFDGTIAINDTETFSPPGNASGVIGLGFSVQLADGSPKITTTEFIKETYALITENFNCERVVMEGQSNCLGVGATSALMAIPYMDVSFDWLKEFDRVYIWDKFAGEYVKLKIGVNNVSAWDGRYTSGTPIPYSTIGLEIGFVLNWLDCNRKGLLFIDKFVKDGAPIADFEKGQSYYTDLLAQRELSNAWLTENRYSAKDIGFIWVQGEGDMFNTESYYYNKLVSLISDRIDDNIISDGSFIVLAQIGSTSDNYSVNIANAKQTYVNNNEKAKMIEYIDEYNVDDIHLNTNGCIQLGLDAYRVMANTDNENFNSVPIGKNNWTV